jgi:hypothetical protein
MKGVGYLRGVSFAFAFRLLLLTARERGSEPTIIYNRLLIRLRKITLEQVFIKKLLRIKYLKVFGCLAYVLKLYKLYFKLDPNFTKTIFVSYKESTC